MLVRDCMTRHPVMINPNMSLPEARKVMVENEFSHLPVVDDGKRLLGLITRSHFALSLDNIDSLDVWEISSKLTDLKVKNVMIKKRQVITISPQTTVEYAAGILTDNDIGCLPVVEDDKLVGMITTIDLMRSYQEMLGLPIPGIRLTVRMETQKKTYSGLARLITSIGDKSWSIMGIGTFRTPNHPQCFDTVIKIPGVTIEEVRELVESIPDQEIVDLREVN